MSGNQDFVRELNEHLSLIQYNKKEVYDELNEGIRSLIRSKK